MPPSPAPTPRPRAGAGAGKRRRSAFLTSADGDAVWSPPTEPPPGFPPLADDERPAPPPENPKGTPAPLTPAEYAGKARIGRPTLRPPSRPDWSDGSGFLFGLVLFALGSAYLRGGMTGPGGVTDWLKAKLFNRTRTDPAAGGGPDQSWAAGPHAGGDWGTPSATVPAPTPGGSW